MAQSGYTPLLVYGSSTAAAEPTAPNLTSSANGAELALNYADGKLFYKNSGGNVRLLAIGYGASTVTPTAGGIQYGTGTAVAFTAAGTAGYILQSNGASAPSWVAAPSTSPGGSTTQVQYNNAGAFGGSANLVWDNSNVRLGIGTSSPATKLDVRGTPGADYGIANIFDTTSAASGVGGVLALSGYKTTTSGAAIFAKIKGIKENATAGNEAGALTFETNSGSAYTERMRITSGGVVMVGATSAHGSEKVLINGGGTSPTGDGYLTLRRGSDASSGSGVGVIDFADTRTSSIYAKIQAIADATPGTNDFPGALVFYTTADGASSTTERMRITSGGQLIVGTTATGTGANSARIYGYAANSTHNGAAIYGYNASIVYPGVGTTRYGVRGETYGYASGSIYGVYGYATDDAVYNTTQYGVYGESGPAIYSPGYGVYAKATHNPTASQTGYALFANMNTTGTGSTATTYGARIENNSTAGATAFGLYVYSATGATTTVPFAVAAGGSELMRINSNGAVCIGTSTASGSRLSTYSTANDTGVYFERNTGATAPTTWPVIIKGQSGGSNSASYGGLYIEGRNGLGNSSAVILGQGVPATYGYHDVGFLQLYGGGFWQAQEYHWSTNGTTTYQGTNYQGCEFYNHRSDSQVAFTFYAASTGQAASVVYSRCARTTTNSTYNLFFGTNGNGTGQFAVRDSGNCVNTNNSYGSISDVKLKQDIVDASNQWDDIKNLRIRKFRWKSEVAENPSAKPYLGLIAQEAELVSPGLIEETADYEEFEEDSLDENGNVLLKEDGTPHKVRNRRALGTTTKSIKYSILYMKAIKALQEAMERIESLEAKVAALEGN